MLWTAGRDGRFNAVSGGALEELGLSAADLLHQPCEILVAEHVVKDVFAGRAAGSSRRTASAGCATTSSRWPTASAR